MSSGTGWGITPQGFVCPQLSDILLEIEKVLQANFGMDINLNPESFFGQIAGIFSERESRVWNAMQDVYNSQNPNTASGASLDNVGALRGISRLTATYSKIQNVRLFGSPGTPAPTTAQFSVTNSPTSIFSPIAATTLVAGQNCVQTLTFSAVPASGTYQLSLGGIETALIDWNDSVATIQSKIRAVLFAQGCVVTQISPTVLQVAFGGVGTGGLMVQPAFQSVGDLLEDSGSNPITITPAITTPGIDQGNVSMQATVKGPIVANAGTLTVITTPIVGLTGVLNTQDAQIGTNVESDNAYRLRMAESLQTAGAGTVEAIRSKLLGLSGVTAVVILENVTDSVDVNGLPAHSFEAFVSGGDFITIAEIIWETKPAGIQTYGNTSVVITDSQGLTHTINYSRPSEVPVYVIANLTVNGSYPVNGDATVKTILLNYINSLSIGQELIVVPQMIAQLATVPGIQSAVLLVGTSPGPVTSNNITPTSFQRLTTESTLIEVNS